MFPHELNAGPTGSIPSRSWVVLFALAALAPPVAAQAPGRPGAYLYVLDLAGTPVGEFPSGLRLLQGTMEVVRKDGQPMLKASAASEFVIPLPAVTAPDGTRRGQAQVRPDTTTRKYEVQLAYTGYTGLADSRDCEALVNQAGYDSLVGTVAGIEPTGRSGDPTTYYGTLRRVVKIDYCLAGAGDDGKWCVATLTGTARMQVELTVHGEEGEGAYLKADPDSLRPLPDAVRVTGTCSQADMDEIRAAFPSGESGGSPSGQPIPETEPPRFHASGSPRLRVGVYPADAEQGGWALRVVRVVP